MKAVPKQPPLQGAANFFLRLFNCLSLAALIAVLLVILAGGIVRMTGSGLGCPDWPKCFGSWIPPTHESQLPPNYQEIFKIQGKTIAPFNPFKTWTEYINRLLGALAGLLVLLAFFSSIPLLKTTFRYIFFCALLSLTLMGLQGWLGAQVVDSLLAPYMVTIHMLLALIIIGGLVFSTFWHRLPSFIGTAKTRIRGIAFLNLLLLMIQVGLGTQVREHVDTILLELTSISVSDFESIGIFFWVHRSFSIIVLLAYLYQAYCFYSLRELWARYFYLGIIPLIWIGLELISGIGLVYAGLPPILQPFHLLVASILFANQFLVVLLLLKGKEKRNLSWQESDKLNWRTSIS
ncbi:MAG: COX15/CtaA family protein [Bacteroidia bacterium]|nr:COX15/CtaA family protein [Bacteroidia bacterium]MDW8157863.1 COX15/CtaA family protein [Bacteroidia bacterium]